MRRIFFFALTGAISAILTLVVGFVLYLNDRPELSVWHLADLDEEFTVDSDVSSFDEYLALEERLFGQLQEEVYDKISNSERTAINRYNKGSLSDPERQPTNWNRSYEFAVGNPKVGVLMIHGLSDSPYSLKTLAESLHGAGAYVVGLRVPGHGTAPSGLTTVAWQDMVAAVQLAVQHLASRVDGQPIHLVGYSNGGALAVNYTLTSIEDQNLPGISSMALISPEIGLPRVAAFAKWQAHLGTWLGLEKLAWNSLLPEYDPYKYGSFAVNAGYVAYQMTLQIQKQLTSLNESGEVDRIPPILAFSSIVDATVSAPALIEGLFDRIEPGGHELVLFDINRLADIDVFLRWSPSAMVAALNRTRGKSYTLAVVTNQNLQSSEVMVSELKPGGTNTVNTNLTLSWPDDIYSLSHVALPFSDKDPVYGANYPAGDDEIHLGALAFRGERGVLQIPASEMLRLRSNPFFPYLEKRVLNFFKLEGTGDVAVIPPGH